MALSSLRFCIKLPVEPARLYDAWLDSKEHAAFTGGPAEVEPHVGGAYRAWGDYIKGTTLELEQGRRIVQTWRASEFPADAAESRIELLFEPDGKGGTLLTLVHTDVPAELADYYEKGWTDYYFRPMRKHFQLKKDKAALKAKAAAKKAAAKKSSKKPAPKKPAPKKPAPKKPAPKKPAPKKPAPKKPAPKKPAPKKATAKPAS